MGISINTGINISQGQITVGTVLPGYTLWSWGRGIEGQIGDGTATTRSSPVQVGSDTTWTKVDSGSSHVIAIKTIV